MKNKSWLSTIFLIAGLLVMAYPITAYALRTYRDRTSVQQFTSGNLSQEKKNELIESIVNYNLSLNDGRFNSQIEELVNPDPNAVSYYDFLQTGEPLATLIIPAIHEKLPIYYGSSENVLRVGVGLMENTSYPGSRNGNSVLTGHRGTYDSNIFRHVDQLVLGDVFYIQDALHLLKYKIYDIKVVKPNEGRLIKIEPGRDIVTLVTCTPYLINTERLLIFSERVNFEPGEAESLLDKEAVIVSEDTIEQPEIVGSVMAPPKTVAQEVRSMGWEMKAIIGVVILILSGLVITLLRSVLKKGKQGVSNAK